MISRTYLTCLLCLSFLSLFRITAYGRGYSAEPVYYTPYNEEERAVGGSYSTDPSSFSDSYYREHIYSYDKVLLSDPTRTALYGNEEDYHPAAASSGMLRSRPKAWEDPQSSLPVGDIPWGLFGVGVLVLIGRRCLQEKQKME